jgi:hypothetical protein
LGQEGVLSNENEMLDRSFGEKAIKVIKFRLFGRILDLAGQASRHWFFRGCTQIGRFYPLSSTLISCSGKSSPPFIFGTSIAVFDPDQGGGTLRQRIPFSGNERKTLEGLIWCAKWE